MFRVLGPDLIIENALKNLEKWPKNQENIYLKRTSAHYCYALLWLCLGFRLYIKLFKIIIEKKKNHQKIRNK